ncbi:MAG TPA: HNH endonuclease family protein [Acidimicrobiales bacterium]|nr:HNH endonuclease family protein [Acidimicrobiales bacterium]
MHDETPASGARPTTRAATLRSGGAGWGADTGRPAGTDHHAGTPSRSRRAAAALAVVAALAGGIGCTEPGLAGGSTTSEPTDAAPSGSGTAPGDPAPAAPGAPASLPQPVPEVGPGPAGVGELIDLLPVAPEADDDGYERDLFGSGWIVADDHGCDTREKVLIDESLTPAQVDAVGCTVVTGDWRSTYDGYETTDPSELDIDHVVALGEAWRSGASRWDDATRVAYANDVDEPRALIAVTASTNRSKGDRDPADWQPPSQESWCAYVVDWVTVKARWGLSADEAEVGALRNMAASC